MEMLYGSFLGDLKAGRFNTTSANALRLLIPEVDFDATAYSHAIVAINLGSGYSRSDAIGFAKEIFDAAIEATDRRSPDNQAVLGELYLQRGHNVNRSLTPTSSAEHGDYREALEYFEDAGKTPLELAEINLQIAAVIEEEVAADGAKRYYENALDLLDEEGENNFFLKGKIWLALGKLELAKGDEDDAIDYFLEAISNFQSDSSDDAYLQEVLARANLIQAYIEDREPELAQLEIERINYSDAVTMGFVNGALYRAQPEYPYVARSTGAEATINLIFTVTTAGSVEDISVFNYQISDARYLDDFVESAIEALEQFRFAPKWVDGVPVAYEHRSSFRFNFDRFYQ